MNVTARQLVHFMRGYTYRGGFEEHLNNTCNIYPGDPVVQQPGQQDQPKELSREELMRRMRED